MQKQIFAGRLPIIKQSIEQIKQLLTETSDKIDKHTNGAEMPDPNILNGIHQDALISLERIKNSCNINLQEYGKIDTVRVEKILQLAKDHLDQLKYGVDDPIHGEISKLLNIELITAKLMKKNFDNLVSAFEKLCKQQKPEQHKFKKQIEKCENYIKTLSKKIENDDKIKKEKLQEMLQTLDETRRELILNEIEKIDQEALFSVDTEEAEPANKMPRLDEQGNNSSAQLKLRDDNAINDFFLVIQTKSYMEISHATLQVLGDYIKLKKQILEEALTKFNNAQNSWEEIKKEMQESLSKAEQTKAEQYREKLSAMTKNSNTVTNIISSIKSVIENVKNQIESESQYNAEKIDKTNNFIDNLKTVVRKEQLGQITPTLKDMEGLTQELDAIDQNIKLYEVDTKDKLESTITKAQPKYEKSAIGFKEIGDSLKAISNAIGISTTSFKDDCTYAEDLLKQLKDDLEIQSTSPSKTVSEAKANQDLNIQEQTGPR